MTLRLDKDTDVVAIWMVSGTAEDGSQDDRSEKDGIVDPLCPLCELRVRTASAEGLCLECRQWRRHMVDRASARG